MGIELPTELAGVAAAAGVQWPRADEDAMRATAQAWRQAGTQTSTLAVDADHTAGRALSVVQGAAGTAATRHWQTFVAPDTGHLSRAARGCLDAADRLDHAADQVGAAKVQIVRHLVTLAQHTDAANQAAAAGHPSALAGLPVAVQGTAVNVAHVNHTLTNSIALPVHGGPLGQPGHGLLPSPASPLGVDSVVTTSAHGPLTSDGPLGQVVQPLTSPALAHPVAVAGQIAQPPASAVHDGVPLGHTVDSVAGQVVQPPASLAHGGGSLGHTVDSVAGSVAPPLTSAGGTALGVAGGVPDHIAPPGDAPIAQPAGPPIPSDPTAGPSQPGGHTPLPGTPSAPGVTVAQSAAPPVAPPPVATASPVATPAQPTAIPPTQNPMWPGTPAPGPIADPAPIAGPTPSAPSPAPSASPTPSAGPAPTAGPPPAASTPATGATPTAGPSRTPASAGNGPSAAIGVVATAPPPRSGARSAVVLPPIVAPPPIQTTPTPRQDELALFLMYLFPDGHQPADANRPVSRQLPPPPPDTDFAAGLRFPPHDHPESHRITAESPSKNTPPSPAQPVPTDLTDGYDPLGDCAGSVGSAFADVNQNEHDWDRRFLVRAGAPAEYAWPPAELFPEGGCAAGEPVVLEPGTTIDRFGTPEGRVFGEAGTPYRARSLPPDHLDAGYRRYRVTRGLPVWRTVSAPWFGQPGGAARLRSVYPAADLVAFGYLAEETHGQ